MIHVQKGNGRSKYSIAFIFLLFAFSCFSNPKPHDYFIRFKDKNKSPYSLTRPLEFLTQKSLDRREKQNILLDSQDLPVNPVYLDSLRKTGAKVLFSSKWFNAATVEIRDTTGIVLDKIQNLSFVDSFNTQLLRKKGGKVKALSQATEENNLGFPTSDYGESFKQISLCNGQKLHEMGYKGVGKIIAIIDAGFFHADRLYAFNKMRNEHRIIATHDFVSDSPGVYLGATHGMFVLSSMGGYMPGKLIGVAPEASFILIHTENDTSEYPVEEDAWVAGVEFADSAGADLINTSLGYTEFDNPALNNTYSELDGKTLRCSIAGNIASRKGIIIEVSAGNEGAKPWHYISAPSDGIDILTTGAVDSNRIITKFSSRGPSADGRIKPDVCAMGYHVIVADSKDSSLASVGGTSLAGPLITGLTACLWNAFPDKTNKEIMNAVRMSADHSMYPDNDYGYGIPDYLLAYRLLKEEASISNSDEYLFQLFPNPFTDYPILNFYSKTSQNLVLSITDMAGKFLFSDSYKIVANSALNAKLSIFQNLPHGMYIVSIKTDRERVMKKIIKE